MLRVPPTIRPPFTPQSLGTSEQGWATLLRDGDIVEVRPGFAVLPGAPITPALRAQSLAVEVPAGVIVGRTSAAWVHTGFGAGRRVCVLYSPGGYRPRDGRRLEICQATVRSWETDTFPAGHPLPDPPPLPESALSPGRASPSHQEISTPAEGRSPAASTPRLISVTNLVRTAMDIATWCLPEHAAPLLAHLVAAGLDVDDALHRLDLVASWRGAEVARTRLLTARRAVRLERPASSR